MLKNDHTPINYLQDWPSHYYEIPTVEEKKAYLKAVLLKQPDSAEDLFRMKLLEKRFFTLSKDGSADAFLHAFTMLGASAAAGVSFLQKKLRKKELLAYMDLLFLTGFEQRPDWEQNILVTEWKDFALGYLLSCFDSKSYRSTLFGMIPMKDHTVARKLASEIKLITKEYPGIFGMEEGFRPLYECFEIVYFQKIEDAKSHWNP